MDLAPGDRVAERYVVESRLGQGAFATVWAVRHAQLGSAHALKVLSAHLEGDARRRFLAEGKIQASLSHPNLVRVTDLVEVGPLLALVLDRVEGETLSERLSRGPPPLLEAWGLGRQILAGVAAAHAASLVHRDLKPSNVLIGRDGVARVSDFGIARAQDPALQGPQTEAGFGMGTPGYMAPEAYVDASSVDARADVFSLGCLLFELLTGLSAFPWPQPWLELYQGALNGRHRLDERAAALPAALLEVLRVALEPVAARRPADSAELLALWRAAEPGQGAEPHPPTAAVGDTSTRVLSVVFTDVVGSTAVRQALGDRAYADAIRGHHAVLREALATTGQEIETAGDSMLASFETPSAALRFALGARAGLRAWNVGRVHPLRDRFAVHLGEVVVYQGRRTELFSLALDTCARVLSLADADQILMTRVVFDSARQHLEEPELTWWNHGRYRLAGVSDPVEVCEVAEAGDGERRPPASASKAVRVDDEAQPTLTGWRPSPGAVVPGTQFVLERALGEGSVGEAWLGRHPTLKHLAVFKFCFDAARVRSLRREAALFRILQERVGTHPNIVRLQDVRLDEPPCYLVTDYAEGRDLLAWWAEPRAEPPSLERRLSLVAQVADALQAAHDAGVLHRDVKPANVLVEERGARLNARLLDFGVGQVLSKELLVGLTREGLSATILAGDGRSTSSTSGTWMYLAPEVMSGGAASPRSDVYSLGVMLWQLVVWDLRRALPTDWQRAVADERVREDLARCLAGDPAERWLGAGELARSLRAWGERRAEPPSRPPRPVERAGPPPAIPPRALARVGPSPWPRRAAVAAVAALLVGATAVGLWWWDGHRDRVDYYAHVQRIDGGWAGLGWLGREPAGRTQYRVRSVGGRAVEVTRLNAQGSLQVAEEGLPGSWIDETGDLGLDVRQLWGSAGLERIDHLRPAGEVLFQERAERLADGVRLRFTDPFGNPTSQTDLDWLVEDHQLDDDGRSVSVRFLGATLQPAAFNGFAGWTLTHDGSGRLTGAQGFGPDGRPTVSGDGWASVVLGYDDPDTPWDPTGAKFLGLDGAVTVHREGFSEIHWETDELGRRVAERYLDREGAPVPNQSTGCFGSIFAWEPDQWTETCVGSDGLPMMSPHQGRAVTRRRLDERGRPVEEATFAPDGEPVVGADRIWARQELSFDEAGHRVGLGPFYGPDGDRLVHPEMGASARERFEGDHRVALDLFGLDGELVVTSFGCAVLTFEWDPTGLLLEGARCLDAERQPTLGVTGAAELRGVYDARGQVVERRTLDAEGRPIADDEGAARWTYTYDDAGRRTSVATWDAEGRPTRDATSGNARVEYGFDERGNEVVRRMYDEGGQLASGATGYAERRQSFTPEGWVASVRYLDERGRPAVLAQGYSGMDYRRDAAGRVVEERFLGPGDVPVSQLSSGCARNEIAFGADGLRQAIRCYGPDDRPASRKDGAHETRFKYNDQGKETWRGFYDAEGRLISTPDGAAQLAFTYDRAGNKVETRWVDPEGQLVVGRRRTYAHEVLTYDANGQQTSRAWFDAEDRPTIRLFKEIEPFEFPVHRLEFVRDPRGLATTARVLDVDGGPSKALGGIAEVRFEYDAVSRMTHWSALGADGEPRLVAQVGAASERRAWDSKGELTASTLYGVDGLPTPGVRGVATERSEFDPRGFPIRYERRGTDGELALGPEGWAAWTATHDHLGHELTRTFLGLEGEVVRERRTTFDARYREVEARFADAAGELVAGPEGWARSTTSHDSRSNVRERAFYDASGGRTPGPEGFALFTARFDEASRELEATWSDASGDPVKGPEGCAHRVRTYDEVGRRATETCD